MLFTRQRLGSYHGLSDKFHIVAMQRRNRTPMDGQSLLHLMSTITYGGTTTMPFQTATVLKQPICLENRVTTPHCQKLFT